MCKREELLPCPCCGNKPYEYVEDSSLVIMCNKCNLSIKRALSPSAEWEKAAVSCRKAWNTRPDKPKGEIVNAGEYVNFSFSHESGYLEFSRPRDSGKRFRVLAECLN